MGHLALIRLPSKASRHNHRARPDAISSQLSGAVGLGPPEGPVSVVVVLVDSEDRHAAAAAIARAFPTFSLKSSSNSNNKDEEGGDSESGGRVVSVSFAGPGGGAVEDWPLGEASALEASQVCASAVRRAARLVDTPPDLMNVGAVVDEALAATARLEAVGAKV